jgi:outer membrane protein OmpA-like peptidoglycan-associated protein
MKFLAVTAAIAGIACSGAAAAQQPETSTQDYIAAIRGVKAATPADVAPAGPAASTSTCENGAERDSHGACPDVSDGPERGFKLISESAARSSAPMTGRAAPARATSNPASTRMATADYRPANRPMAPVRSAEPDSLLGSLRIGFRAGSADLTAQGEAELKKFAVALKAVPDVKFEIAGHTDTSGTADGNLVLSQRRAESVKAFLVAEGVDPSHLEAKGYGSAGLAYPDLPRDPRNRRVEARLIN